MSPALAVFAKYPEPGKVKTRLAKSVGNQQAAIIYERLLGHFHEHTLSKLSGFHVTWFCDPTSPLAAYRELLSFTGFPVELQTGKDLGERMRSSLHALLAGHDRAIVVGTDCPDLSPAGLADAARCLDENDLVLGQAGDGGYYLLGVKRDLPELFTGIPWSTDQVAKLTLDKARVSGLKTAQLPLLRDIDDNGDWKAIGWRVDEENDSIRKLRRRKR